MYFQMIVLDRDGLHTFGDANLLAILRPSTWDII